MSSNESTHAATHSADTLQPGVELAPTRLTLMRQLQASLAQSCKALLALDLAGIERGTREQVGLSQELAEGFARAGRELGGDEGEELRQNELGVLQALRLQSALLARARCKLRVLANMLAGPSASYGPPRSRADARPHAFRGTPSRRN